MGPQACWNEIKAILEGGVQYPNSLTEPDYEELAEHLEALAEWIRKGGFWPKP